MRKFLLLFLLVSQFATAQLQSGFRVIYPKSFSDTCFTLNNSNQFASYRYNYLPSYPSDSGIFFGNNVYGQKEVVQVYTKSLTDSIGPDAILSYIQALFFKTVNSNNSNTFARIYNVNPSTNEPTTLISGSFAVPMSQTIAVVNYTNYFLNAVVPITYASLPTKFAISLVLPTGLNDSVGLFSTLAPCGGGDSLVWLKQADNSWINMKDWFLSSFKSDLHLHAVFDNTNSVKNLQVTPYFSIALNDDKAFIISDDLSNIDHVSFTDLSGRALYASDLQVPNSLVYQLGDLQSGIYLATIFTKDKQVHSVKLIK